MFEKIKKYISRLRKWCKDNTTLSLFIFLLVIGSISAYSKYELDNHNLSSYQEYLDDIASGKVDEVRINQLTKQVEYEIEDERKRAVLVDADQVFAAGDHEIAVKPLVDKQTTLFSEIVWVVIKAALFSLLLTLILRSTRDMDSKGVIEEKPNVTYDDVKGCDVAKAEFIEIIDQFKRRDELAKLNIRCPKGVLLSGPPGVGKTLLAKAAANECGTAFIEVSGSEFNEMFYGVGSMKLRAMFTKARMKSPCIIYIDEAESVLGSRSFSEGSVSKNNNQSLNQILTELDGFKETSGVFVIASTNFPDALDKAVTRPGRIDQKITIELPEASGREELLVHYLKDQSIADDVDPHQLSFTLYGMTGSDIENLVRHAKILASKADGIIELSHLQESRDRVLIGQKKNVKILEEEREITAYHEAGHAIIGWKYLPHQLIDTVTIAPRGNAGGYTLFMPKEDKKFQTRKQVRSQIATLMGGRVAEEIVYGKDGVTTGASNDLEVATGLAKDYVGRFGFGQFLTVELEHQKLSPALHRSGTKDTYGVEALLVDAYESAMAYLESQKDYLEKLKDALLEHETITFQQLEVILDGMD